MAETIASRNQDTDENHDIIRQETSFGPESARELVDLKQRVKFLEDQLKLAMAVKEHYIEETQAEKEEKNRLQKRLDENYEDFKKKNEYINSLKDQLQDAELSLSCVMAESSKLHTKIEALEKMLSVLFEGVAYPKIWEDYPNYLVYVEDYLKNNVLSNVRFDQATDGEAPFDLSVINKVNDVNSDSACVLCTLALIMLSIVGIPKLSFSWQDAALFVAFVYKCEDPNVDLLLTKQRIMELFQPGTVLTSIEDFMAPLTKYGIIEFIGSENNKGDLFNLNELSKRIANADDQFNKDKLLMCGYEFRYRQGHMFGVARIKTDNTWKLYPIDGQTKDGKCSLLNFVGVEKVYLYAVSEKGKEKVREFISNLFFTYL